MFGIPIHRDSDKLINPDLSGPRAGSDKSESSPIASGQAERDRPAPTPIISLQVPIYRDARRVGLYPEHRGFGHPRGKKRSIIEIERRKCLFIFRIHHNSYSAENTECDRRRSNTSSSLASTRIRPSSSIALWSESIDFCSSPFNA